METVYRKKEKEEKKELAALARKEKMRAKREKLALKKREKASDHPMLVTRSAFSSIGLRKHNADVLFHRHRSTGGNQRFQVRGSIDLLRDA